MNAYKELVDSYKQVLKSCDESKNIEKAVIRAKIKALEPFSERTNEEIAGMFDSGAFNNVLKAYCKVAMQNCNITKKKINEVMEEIKWLLDTVGANEILDR